MGAFQLDTDHFGLADTNLRLVSSKKAPRPKQYADVVDSNGNIAARSYYGTTTIMDADCEYNLVSGSKDIATLKLGRKSATIVISGIDGKTSNVAWPTISVKGVTGCVGLDSLAPTFTLPTKVLLGKKIAQAIFCTIGGTGKLTGSGFAASCKVDEVMDSKAAVAAMAVSGSELILNGNATELNGPVTVSWDTAVTEIQKPGADKSNVAYGTTSFSAGKFIAKD